MSEQVEQLPSSESELPKAVQKSIDDESRLLSGKLQYLVQEGFIDEMTAEMEVKTLGEHRNGEYEFLNWYGKNFQPSNVLYPGSGSDRIPKLALSEKEVVHTSLEMHDKTGESEEYFKKLGSGKKVISYIDTLPFGKSTFNTIILMELESPFIHDEASQRNKDELDRVLKDGGHIIFSLDLNTEEDWERLEEYENLAKSTFPNYELVKLPEEAQHHGDILDVNYYLLQKRLEATS